MRARLLITVHVFLDRNLHPRMPLRFTHFFCFKCYHIYHQRHSSLGSGWRLNYFHPLSGAWTPPINNCNYDMSGEMFRWLGVGVLPVRNVHERSGNSSSEESRAGAGVLPASGISGTSSRSNEEGRVEGSDASAMEGDEWDPAKATPHHPPSPHRPGSMLQLNPPGAMNPANLLQLNQRDYVRPPVCTRVGVCACLCVCVCLPLSVCLSLSLPLSLCLSLPRWLYMSLSLALCLSLAVCQPLTLILTLTLTLALQVPSGWTLTSALLDAVGWVYAPQQCRCTVRVFSRTFTLEGAIWFARLLSRLK
jgi:hypothetical protein